MAKPVQEPEIKPFDPTGMTDAERLKRLEELYETALAHQATMGSALVALHNKMITFAAELEDGGVREAAELARAEREQRSAVFLQPQPAPLVHPGGHPLKKG